MFRIDRLEPNGFQNGNMEIAQRALSLTGITSGTKQVVDRYKFFNNSGRTYRLDRTTSKPSFSQAKFQGSNCVRVELTGTGVLNTSQDLFYVMEGLDWSKFFGNYMFVQFWTRAKQPGTYSFAMRSPSADASYVEGYTIDAADVWQRQRFLIPPPPIGTWAFDNTQGVLFNWNFGNEAAGNIHSAPGTWEGSNAVAVSSQLDGVAAVGDYFELTQPVILPVSESFRYESLEIPFRRYGNNNYQDELEATRRLYQAGETIWTGEATSGITYHEPVDFSVEMRATPSVSVVNQSSSGFVSHNSNRESTTGFEAIADCSSTGTNRFFRVLWTANADF